MCSKLSSVYVEMCEHLKLCYGNYFLILLTAVILGIVVYLFLYWLKFNYFNTYVSCVNLHCIKTGDVRPSDELFYCLICEITFFHLCTHSITFKFQY